MDESDFDADEDEDEFIVSTKHKATMSHLSHKELLVAGDEEASLLIQASIPFDEKMVPPKGAADSMLKGKLKRKASTAVDVKDRKKAFTAIIEQQEAAHRGRKKTLSHVHCTRV